MTIYDISLTISPGLPVWPGDPAVALTQVAAIARGDLANVSHISMGVHTGTHVDAPHHFLDDNRTVEALPLDVLTGPCYVIHFPDDVDVITAEVLARSAWPAGVTRVLFGTRNSKMWARGENTFQTDFVAVSEDGAQWLVERGVRLVGVDYLSVAPYDQPRPTHEVLLRAGVVIVEGLNLAAVPRGFYDLYCLPLKIAGSDGAPARAILVG
ncbi:MAG: cyclase family protein [Anaerolineales bacterium]